MGAPAKKQTEAVLAYKIKCLVHEEIPHLVGTLHKFYETSGKLPPEDVVAKFAQRRCKQAQGLYGGVWVWERIEEVPF